ncbi:MAG: DUF2834 domain-containing protein [Oscillatoriaceae bacterium SKW80]|nr:DUF2834 domain-containing protein [Oscillatoriaceae bacterium SKYG93]MCX8119826.1 DUF2834 domain-containing protein [Oscillatoriaceae bacterium SKW80]MDW8452069.1 DUF2834 domain-containing protein [Oscillatoriaceae cyanobacterium SKYGB_i_bin93]HIK27492.1 DUF2834 domain-containing protein [Oscillatoriaceae cyanobacterium M7585_C2015_266]
MLRKIGFGLLWLGFLAYAFLLAPPVQPETWTLIKNLSIGNWQGINPALAALFSIMGIWPMIYSCLLYIDGRGQKIPAWPFAVASFAVGAFALLPYLALREPNPKFSGTKNIFLKQLDSRFTGIILTLITAALVAYGLVFGDWNDFIQQWLSNRFIHVMSLDFCMLSVIFPALLGDDMARRGIKNAAVFWIVTLIPLFGPLAYLCTRQPLPETNPC